jgi:predicted SnoaL-like aldol condensation-catalyzing enzyme
MADPAQVQEAAGQCLGDRARQVVREPGARGSAHVDIFRLDNGKVAEHWDVDEPIPAEIGNPNGPF